MTRSTASTVLSFGVVLLRHGGVTQRVRFHGCLLRVAWLSLATPGASDRQTAAGKFREAQRPYWFLSISFSRTRLFVDISSHSIDLPCVGIGVLIDFFRLVNLSWNFAVTECLRVLHLQFLRAVCLPSSSKSSYGFVFLLATTFCNELL